MHRMRLLALSHLHHNLTSRGEPMRVLWNFHVLHASSIYGFLYCGLGLLMSLGPFAMHMLIGHQDNLFLQVLHVPPILNSHPLSLTSVLVRLIMFVCCAGPLPLKYLFSMTASLSVLGNSLQVGMHVLLLALLMYHCH